MMRTNRYRFALAVLGIGFGWGDRAEAGGITINTPTGLVAGDTFRIVFVTQSYTTATSASIGTYNTYVSTEATSEAGGAVTYEGTTLTWSAIGSTATTSAISNIGETGAAVYLADGTEVASSDNGTGLWSGSLSNAIDKDIAGTTVSAAVWTGTTTTGAASSYALGDTDVTFGEAADSDANWVNHSHTVGSGHTYHFYGISQELTVGSVPEPSSLLLATMGAVGVGVVCIRSRGRRPQRTVRP